MVHKPATFAYDFWLRGNAEPQVELSCLMPNGVYIPIEANRDATLQEIKEVGNVQCDSVRARTSTDKSRNVEHHITRGLSP
ncbi:hypothetical protein PR048_031893 [Dryococelus australis]|uniref:Uncharacterized protein n=1 Tax=Dryococelus australis TaxID=614101 RepID=A0ABQ9G6K0_9NEOP|nr:hypothetical protein PR048_031893 [Dryococelus australis]